MNPLLTYKIFNWNQKTRKLSPYSLDWEWPYWRIVKASCRHGHEAPADNCSCGIYSTLDALSIAQIPHCKVEDVMPIVGVIQNLGRVVIDRKMVRSERAFLYGVVLPSEVYDNDDLRMTWRDDFFYSYRCIAFNDIRVAHLHSVDNSWRQWGLK
ncbi:MAG TPA: hypothetical protein PKD55_01400 [Bellilinea sp.]|nr:hypothetical protein [Bellilinea sp.]